MARKRNEILIHATSWMKLKDILGQRSRSQKLHIVGLHLYEASRISESVEIENELVIYLRWGGVSALGKMGSDH